MHGECFRTCFIYVYMIGAKRQEAIVVVRQAPKSEGLEEDLQLTSGHKAKCGSSEWPERSMGQ